jgi:hypothetical protein
LVHVKFLVSTKNINFIKYQLFNISAKFTSNGPSDFREDFNNSDDNSSPDQKGQKSQKKVQMALTYHTLVSQGMSNICISVLFIPGLYSNVLPYFQQCKMEIIGPGKVGKF